MNPRDNIDGPSRSCGEGSSTAAEKTELQNNESTSKPDQSGMKRATAKKLIESFFYQLVDGCGDPNCANQNCASSGEGRELTRNEAAAEAIRLFSQDAKLCTPHVYHKPIKVAKTNKNHCPIIHEAGASHSIAEPNWCEDCVPSLPLCENSEVTQSGGDYHEEKGNDKDLDGEGVPDTNVDYLLPTDGCKREKREKLEQEIVGVSEALSEDVIRSLCLACLEAESGTVLCDRLEEALAKPVLLLQSFRLPHQGTDKDETSEKASDREALDVPALKRAMDQIRKLPVEYYSEAIHRGLKCLSETLEIDVKVTNLLSTRDLVECYVIAFALPCQLTDEYFVKLLPELYTGIEALPIEGHAGLVTMFATYFKEELKDILEMLQQIITLRVVSTDYSDTYILQDDETLGAATKFMQVIFYANLLAGTMESDTLKETEVIMPRHQDSLVDILEPLSPYISTMRAATTEVDELGIFLNLNVLYSRKPLIPLEEFYNEPLCEIIEMDKDFAYYKAEIGNAWEGRKFAFLHYPFILTPVTKILGLYYDSRIRMYAERRASMLHSVFTASDFFVEPILRLKVNRENIIADALVELEMVAEENPSNLKKQLVVEFEGEQGVDEGGVSKEFFQLIVEEIFNPDYGMFTVEPDTHTVWFNPTSFESEDQFTLIGIVLGLAIYNSVILAVNFPMFLYRKLLGKKGSFDDLAEWNPSLYSGLKNLLEYTGADIEQVYMQTFRIGYRDVFGTSLCHELKENGDQIPVTQQNKQEFVELYADFLLNSSVEMQFSAFRRGFLMVTSESPLSTLFRAEELEACVCGSKNFDFKDLESTAEYSGGFTASSQTVLDFWAVVHEMSLDDKKRLLQFTTGSDRVPVGGLGRVRIVLTKHSDDEDRLPAAHTCYNVLLLPAYSDRNILRERLMTAITYSKGFGMI